MVNKKSNAECILFEYKYLQNTKQWTMKQCKQCKHCFIVHLFILYQSIEQKLSFIVLYVEVTVSTQAILVDGAQTARIK